MQIKPGYGCLRDHIFRLVTGCESPESPNGQTYVQKSVMACVDGAKLTCHLQRGRREGHGCDLQRRRLRRDAHGDADQSRVQELGRPGPVPKGRASPRDGAYPSYGIQAQAQGRKAASTLQTSRVAWPRRHLKQVAITPVNALVLSKIAI